jgi:hypothetical protein
MNIPPSMAANLLHAAYGVGPAQAAHLLKVVGYPLDAVKGAIEGVYRISGDALKNALSGAGYAMDSVSRLVDGASSVFSSAADTLNPTKW